MRTFVTSVLVLSFLFLLFPHASFSQNVNYEVEVIALRCNIASDGIFSGPDPTWKVWANDNADPIYTGGNCIFRDDVTLGQYTLDTNDISGALPYNIRTVNNSPATHINIKFQGFEKDCAWFGVTDRCTYDGCCDHPFCLLADEDLCDLLVIGTIPFTNDPQCQWNYYGWFSCGVFDVKVRVRWEIANPPVILTQPTANGNDTVLCAPVPLTLAVICDSSAIFYQWQVTANTDLNPTSGWSDIPGATGTTYTVPVIYGTRNYRVLISSGCIPGFNLATTISNSVRVTYQPYPPVPIDNPLCGSMVLPYSTHYFSVLLPPDSGAVINPTAWLWAGTPGLIIQTPNAPGTNITFPSYGLYQITVEYIDACQGANTVSPPCTVIVGSDHCDYVYVAPWGSDTATSGTPLHPVKTLAYALTMATGTRNTIRMAGGIYDETAVIFLTEDITIDGGYAVNNNIWIKSSAENTMININPPLETTTLNNYILGFFRGIAAGNVSGWTLQDIEISVKAGGSSGTTGRSGHSIYGLHITDSCNNYLISRCRITAGMASGGENGLAGSAGLPGNNGFDGIAGGEIHNTLLNCDLDANGFGGAGGTSVGAGVRMGGSGGNGGRGGYDEFAVSTAGENGFPGLYGGGGAVGGMYGGIGGVRTTHCYPGNGSAGQNGLDGSNGLSYFAPAVTNYNYSNHYWIPAYGNNGGDGGGGGGGQGGGGSSGQGTGAFPWCLPGRGNGGGGGSSGGEGGQGGEGGGGGGASFVIYASGWGNGILTSSVLVSPAGLPAAGGTGAGGSNGGFSGLGGLGDQSCLSENGGAGNGGIGGKGGNGGKGQDGSSGIIADIATGNNSILSGTSSLIPHPTEITVNYNNFRGCTFSELPVTKLTGNWALPAGAYYVNNINDTTSQFNNTSDSALIYFDATGVYDIGANGGIFETFIRITDLRVLPEIHIYNEPSCYDSMVYLIPSIPALEYDWLVYISSPDSAIFASSAAMPQMQGLPEGEYYVRLRQRDICCGWSIPVYKKLSVYPELYAGIIAGDTTRLCYGQSDTLFSQTPASGGNGNSQSYQWQMSTTTSIPGTQGQWTDIPGADSASLVTGAITDTVYFVRQVTDSCGVVYSNVITMMVYPELQGGVIAVDTMICSGSPAPWLSSLQPASGGSGTGLSYQWYASTTTSIPGGPGWNSIPSATADSCLPGMLAQTTYFVREVTDSCGATWSNVITITVVPVPDADAGLPAQYCDTLIFSLDAFLSAGTGEWYQASGPGTSAFTPDNQQPDPLVQVSTPGIYSYLWVVTDGPCSDSGMVNITVSAGPDLLLSPDEPEICEGDSIELSVTGALSYIWMPAGFLSSDSASTVICYPPATTTYQVTGISAEGCSSVLTVEVIVNDYPVVELGEDIYLCAQPMIALDAGEGNQIYQWSDGSGQQVLEVSLPGTYWVIAGNNNCFSSDTIVIMPCEDVFIPNVFTPNGDGKNDLFYAKGTFGTYRLSVFNRWGKLVFSADDVSVKWDGTIKGEEAAVGAYYWVLEYSTRNFADQGAALTRNGWVQLVR